MESGERPPLAWLRSAHHRAGQRSGAQAHPTHCADTADAGAVKYMNRANLQE